MTQSSTTPKYTSLFNIKKRHENKDYGKQKDSVLEFCFERRSKIPTHIRTMDDGLVRKYLDRIEIKQDRADAMIGGDDNDALVVEKKKDCCLSMVYFNFDLLLLLLCGSDPATTEADYTQTVFLKLEKSLTNQQPTTCTYLVTAFLFCFSCLLLLLGTKNSSGYFRDCLDEHIIKKLELRWWRSRWRRSILLRLFGTIAWRWWWSRRRWSGWRGSGWHRNERLIHHHTVGGTVPYRSLFTNQKILSRHSLICMSVILNNNNNNNNNNNERRKRRMLRR